MGRYDIALGKKPSQPAEPNPDKGSKGYVSPGVYVKDLGGFGSQPNPVFNRGIGPSLDENGLISAISPGPHGGVEIDVTRVFPAEPPPMNLRELRTWFRFLYNSNGLVASYIDTLTHRANRGVVHRGIPRSFVIPAAHEYFLFGNAFLTQGADGWTILNPDAVRIITSPTGRRQYFLNDVGLVPGYRTGPEIENMVHLARRSSFYDPLGMPVIRLGSVPGPLPGLGDPQFDPIDTSEESIQFNVHRFVESWEEAFRGRPRRGESETDPYNGITS